MTTTTPASVPAPRRPRFSRRIAAAIAIPVLALAGAGIAYAAVTSSAPPRATVATCTREIIAHPDEARAGPGCRGLTRDQVWQATIAAMQQGAIG